MAGYFQSAFQWDAFQTADLISIERKTGSGGEYAEVYSGPWGALEWTDLAEDLATGNTYYYKARHYLDGTYSGYSNEVSVAYSTAPPGAAVTQVAGTLTATGGTQVAAAVRIAAVAQSAGTLTATGGTQVAAATILATVAQAAATLTATGGTQVAASVSYRHRHPACRYSHGDWWDSGSSVRPDRGGSPGGCHLDDYGWDASSGLYSGRRRSSVRGDPHRYRGDAGSSCCW